MGLGFDTGGRGPPFGTDDLEEIRAGLIGAAEALALDLLGEPSSKSGREWRWGTHGSLSLVMRGAKRGAWHDHEAVEGGDGLALIQRQRGGTFPEALDYARGFLGLQGRSAEPSSRKRQDDEAARRRREEAEAEDATRVTTARRVWGEGTPIAAGDLADIYLTETRGIPRPAAGWPQALRYHRGRNALMVAATDAADAVQAVQLVHLTSEARKRADAPNRPTKQSFGLVSGNVVRLPGRGEPLLLAEGPETGLSLWAATGRPTWIALGSMSKVELPAGHLVVCCADDDKREAPAQKVLRRAVGQWRSAGHAVALAFPWAKRREDRSDFNDVLREAGAEAVVARVERVITGMGTLPPTVPLEIARQRLDGAVAGFFDAARAWDREGEAPPLVHAIRAGVGTGKSAVARIYAARELAAMRQRGNGRTIVILVPTHRLGTEQAERFMVLPEAQAAGLTAAVWRGREAPDPDQPGEAMCLSLDVVREAMAHGLEVEGSCCRRRVKDSAGERVTFTCPFYETCAYQRQKAQQADIWIAAHEMLFGAKPSAFGKVELVIVDEAPWQAGLEGVEGRPVTLSLDALTLGPQGVGRMDAKALAEIYGWTRHVLTGQPDGPLRREAALAAGLDASIAGDGRALTWDRKVDPTLLPGEPPEKRKAALAKAAENRAVIRTAKLFHALHALLQPGGPEASGWLHLGTEEGEHGPVRVARLRGRRQVNAGWIAPTLLLDATLDAELLRPYWPQIEVTAEIEAEAPHQRIRQLVGRDIGKTTLMPDEWREYDPENNQRDKSELKRRASRNAEARAIALREARAAGAHLGAYDGQPAGALIVLQKGIEEAWREAGALPSYVDLAHHNGVAGIDRWRGVRAEIVIGRTLPRESDVERLAEALTGAAVTVSGRYEREDAEIVLRDGSTVQAEAWRHPDPMAEAVRWQICEGELIQIIGRCRGVNRTAADPVDVLLLTDRPLPLAVDAVVTWDNLAPDPADLMLGLGGVVLTDAADAARAYPELWPSAEAAKKAVQRARCGTSPLERLLKGECPAPLLRQPYHRAGAGRRPTMAVYDPAVVSDPAAWLTARLGELRPAPPASNPAALASRATAGVRNGIASHPPTLMVKDVACHTLATVPVPLPPGVVSDITAHALPAGWQPEPAADYKVEIDTSGVVLPEAALDWLELLDRPPAPEWVPLPELPAPVLFLPETPCEWPAGDVEALLALALGEPLLEPEPVSAPVLYLDIADTLGPAPVPRRPAAASVLRPVPPAPHPDLVAQFRGLAEALDDLPPPPRVHGDGLDLVRRDHWRRITWPAWAERQAVRSRPRMLADDDQPNADEATP